MYNLNLNFTQRLLIKEGKKALLADNVSTHLRWVLCGGVMGCAALPAGRR